jgi:effector-binding domain-containing protein
MSGFEFRTVPLQHTAVVKVTTTTDKIGESMGEAIGKAFAAVGRAGAAPIGPVMTKYTAYSEESVSYETGVPVAAPFAGDGEVGAGEIGGCEAAVGMHVGPYDTIGQTYGQLQAWIESQGRTPSVVMWESYLDDPQTTDASKLRTEVFWPLEDALAT